MGFEPSKGEGVPTTGETLYGPTVATIFSVQGSQHSPVRNFRVSGVIFKHVAPSFLEPYAVPSGGDYSLHKGGTVLLNGTEDCTVDHSLFDGNGGNGVFLNDYNRRALVAANEFRDMGEAVSLHMDFCAFCLPQSTVLPLSCDCRGFSCLVPQTGSMDVRGTNRVSAMSLEITSTTWDYMFYKHLASCTL